MISKSAASAHFYWAALPLRSLSKLDPLCALIDSGRHYDLLDTSSKLWSGPDFEVLAFSSLPEQVFGDASCFEQARDYWRDLLADAHSIVSPIPSPSTPSTPSVLSTPSISSALSTASLPLAAPFALGGFCFDHAEGGFLTVPTRALIVAGDQKWFYCAGFAPEADSSLPRDLLLANVPSEALLADLPCDPLLAELISAPEKTSDLLADEALKLLTHLSQSPRHVASSSPELQFNPVEDEQDWGYAVAKASSLIRSGELDKVVLARSADMLVTPPPRLGGIVSQLKAAYPQCWVYRLGSLLGASPEMLASVREGRFLSRVLAGSVSPGEEDELCADPKQIREHEVAVRSALEALSEIELEVSVEGPYVLKLSNISHLATDISAVLPPAIADDTADSPSIWRIAESLHPTAAVCGLPRKHAGEVISVLEGRSRGLYAGLIGWVDASEQGQWALALRCAEADPEQPGLFRLWAGAGIMGDSVPEKEIAETNTKFSAVRIAIESASKEL